MKIGKKQIVKISLTAVMIALNVVLERFLSIQSAKNQYSFSVITIVFAAVYLGLPSAICVGALGDIAGALLFPTGAYFPGFTLTNILFAVVYYVFLHKKVNMLNTAVSVILNKILGTLLMNSVWIVMISSKLTLSSLPAYMIARIPQAIIMTAVDIVLITLFFNCSLPTAKSLKKAVAGLGKL